MMPNSARQVRGAIEAKRNELFQSLRMSADWGERGIQIFMESHVWAVWDFMSLVKALQLELTCVSLPWVPNGEAEARRFVNEIVFGEESDIDRHGKATSHFEMYLAAMKSIGANTAAIESFIREISEGANLQDALRHAPNRAVRNFVTYTFQVIAEQKLHLLTSVFTFGREDLIPEMFLVLLNDLKERAGFDNPDLRYYLERHIEVDGHEHGPIAMRMVSNALGDHSEKIKEATQAANKAIDLRIELWKSISEQIHQETSL